MSEAEERAVGRVQEQQDAIRRYVSRLDGKPAEKTRPELENLLDALLGASLLLVLEGLREEINSRRSRRRASG